jgi:dTMP kinase
MNQAIRFITFEGPEGAGKTTQCFHLAAWLESRGVNVLVTRQPGGEAVGQKLRAILLDRSEAPLTREAEVLLMMADRSMSVANVIRPHLEAGGTVLCDRYADSSMAYQGYGRGLDIDLVERLNHVATGGLLPDLTILIDIDPELGLARQSKRTRMEDEGLEFHRRVHAGFLEIARQNPNRIVTIDGENGVNDIAERIRAVYEARSGNCTR